MTDESDPRKKRRPMYADPAFLISIVTFLVLFGILVAGGVIGIAGLVRSLLSLLGYG